MPLVPSAFLFRPAFPIARLRNFPKTPSPSFEGATIPMLSALDEQPIFATVRAAWHPEGMLFGVEVTGRETPLMYDPGEPAGGDGVHLWIDTRNTKTIHRAGRFCHHMIVTPIDDDGDPKPRVRPRPVPRAQQDARLADSGEFAAATELTADGYRLAWTVPADTLTGYDPAANALIGFYIVVKDLVQGEQVLTVDRALPFESDPSVWATLRLEGVA